MKLFLLGDFETDTGPGVANKHIRDALSQEYYVCVSKGGTKASRILEVIGGIIKNDVLIICSKSQINKVAINIAKIMRKKIIYIMHGCSIYEAKLQDPSIAADKLLKIRKYEELVLSEADIVLSVSKLAMKCIADEYPHFSNKLDYIYNVIDISKIHIKHEKKSKNHVISIGGGMRQKNNLIVAEAIDELNKEHDLNIIYTVIGKELEYGESLKKHSFVEYYEHIPHSDLMQLMAQCNLYVQNSIFETFGLSVVEAMSCGCDLLISYNIGCKELFQNICPEDVIENVRDKCEIKRKILYNLMHENNERMNRDFQWELIGQQALLKRFETILKRIY